MPRSKAYSAKPKSAVLDRPDGPIEREKSNTVRYIVRVTAFRARSVDPDNLCAKYFVDALRYSGIISDDRKRDIIYSIQEEDVASKVEEKTLIEVTEL